MRSVPCDQIPSVQVDALPRNALVELQPVAADAATSSPADEDSEVRDGFASTAAEYSRSNHLVRDYRMEGWIGRLQNSCESRRFQAGCGVLELLVTALFSPGKLCRCHASLEWTITEPVQPCGQVSAYLSSHATIGKCFSLNGRECPESTSEVAASVLNCVKGHISSAAVTLENVSSFKLYWRQHNQDAKRLAMALQISIENEYSPSCVILVPVVAVGSEATLKSLLVLEVLALK